MLLLETIATRDYGCLAVKDKKKNQYINTKRCIKGDCI